MLHNDSEFTKKLTNLLNCTSQENGSNTPDFILAEYLRDCLDVFNNTLQKREKWYGRNISGYTANHPLGERSKEGDIL